MPGKFRDAWYYPEDIAHDLDGVTGLSEALKEEAYACAWEYTRCVIPQYTNWDRYVAFMRTIIIGIIAEFRGELVDVAKSDNIMGYSLNGVLDALFEGTPGHSLMVREYKTFLLVTSEKTSKRRDSELFRRYVNGLASSPRAWFRMRDCDALARFSLAAALACNDVYDVYPTETQWEVLTEIGDTLYDAVAFFKHRSEGETNSTFAYVPPDLRIEAFRVAREMLWAIDVAWARKPGGLALLNFTRFFGGPIHMMMRRYRFVEEDLTIGKAETAAVFDETRHNVKLWNRVDAQGVQVTEMAAPPGHRSNPSVDSTSSDNSTSNSGSESAKSCSTSDTEPDLEAPGADRFWSLMERSEELMFPELPGYLKRSGTPSCNRCNYRASYGAQKLHRFGGVALCRGCRAMWRGYILSLPERVLEAFPDVVLRAPPPADTRGKKRPIDDLEADGQLDEAKMRRYMQEVDSQNAGVAMKEMRQALMV